MNVTSLSAMNYHLALTTTNTVNCDQRSFKGSKQNQSAKSLLDCNLYHLSYLAYWSYFLKGQELRFLRNEMLSPYSPEGNSCTLGLKLQYTEGSECMTMCCQIALAKQKISLL